jgi:hypothetical protein
MTENAGWPARSGWLANSGSYNGLVNLTKGQHNEQEHRSVSRWAHDPSTSDVLTSCLIILQ